MNSKRHAKKMHRGMNFDQSSKDKETANVNYTHPMAEPFQATPKALAVLPDFCHGGR